MASKAVFKTIEAAYAKEPKNVITSLKLWYLRKITGRMAKLGMTWHDAVAENPVYEKAISRLPAEMQVERSRRIKRAFDMSQKHAEMPAHMQEDPLREAAFVHTVLTATQAEEDEKRVLAGKPIVPFSLGREKWFSYDTKKAWWWKN